MRTDVQKRADFIVRAAANDNRLARNRSRTKIIWIRQFGLVTNRNPGFLKDFFLFLFEDLLIRINAAVDPFRRFQIRLCQPLAVIFCSHEISSSKWRRPESVGSTINNDNTSWWVPIA